MRTRDLKRYLKRPQPEVSENHLDIYIYLKFQAQNDLLFTSEELIKKINAEYSHHFYTAEELLQCFEGLGKPKTRLLVHRLTEMGYSNKTIAKWLDISPSTISIHLSKPLKDDEEYSNYRLIEYYNSKMYILQNHFNEY